MQKLTIRMRGEQPAATGQFPRAATCVLLRRQGNALMSDSAAFVVAEVISVNYSQWLLCGRDRLPRMAHISPDFLSRSLPRSNSRECAGWNPLRNSAVPSAVRPSLWKFPCLNVDSAQTRTRRAGDVEMRPQLLRRNAVM